MQRTDWGDLKIVQAVRAEGSIAGAARRLGVNASTVLRRIAALERAWGVRLFDRLPRGYVPTPAGTLTADQADRISEAVDELEREVVGRDISLSGTLRVTTTDTLMASVLPAFLRDFAGRHPAIRLEIVQTNELLSLMQREADVAVRPSVAGSDALSGIRISEIAFAAYVATATGTVVGTSAPSGWVGLADSLHGTSAARWLAANVEPEKFTISADSLVAARDLAIAGAGQAFLPCYLGDTSPELRRLSSIKPVRLSELWVVAHKDLRRTVRVHRFMEEAADHLRAMRSLMEGEAGSNAPAGATEL